MPDEDITIIIEKIEAVLRKYPRAQTYIKWTCPACGERATDDQPHRVALGGYTHTEKADGSPCGATYTGRLYGIRLVLPGDTWATTA